MTTPHRDPPYSRAGCIAFLLWCLLLGLGVAVLLLWWLV